MIRHAEAAKNLRGEHGGDGSSLTERGRGEADSLGISMRADGLPRAKFVCIDRLQCIETAEILAEKFGASPKVVSFPPFSLGVLDGLSQAVASEKFPKYAALMEQWRAGHIEAHELAVIPGASSAHDFFLTGQELLKLLIEISLEGTVVFVATRSVLVLLGNIVLGNHSRVGGGYREIPWPNLAFATVDGASCNSLEICRDKTNVARFL